MKQACLAVGQADIVQTLIRTYRGYTFQVEIFVFILFFERWIQVLLRSINTVDSG